MRRLLRAMATAVAMISAAVAGAETSPSMPACVPGKPCQGLSADDMFALADRLERGGQPATAAKLLSGLLSDPHLDYRCEARFRLAHLRLAAGDERAAIALYRAILDERPDAGNVRIELAALLARTGDDGEARRQLSRAMAGGLPPTVLAIADKFRVALRSRRRFGGSVEIDLAPNSNINRATADHTLQIGDIALTLDRDARMTSGVGVNLSGQTFWRPRLSHDIDLLLTVSETANIYRAHRFDDVTAATSAGIVVPVFEGRMTIGGAAARRWIGEMRYSDSYGPTLSWLRPVSHQSQIQIDAGIVRMDNARDSQQTGTQFGLGLIGEHAISPRLYARLMLRADRRAVRSAAFSDWTVGSEALISRDIGRQTIYARAQFYRTIGDAAFVLPPARRNDRLFGVEGGIQLRRFAIGGLSPVIRIAHSENASPVIFYRFQQSRIEFGLVRIF